jgi:hypothetical protein
MEYLVPWQAANDATLLDELRRELAPNHILWNVPLAAKACRQDRDDVLYEFLDGSGRLAAVHLTYRKEVSATWPMTTLYENCEEWQAAMLTDHAEYTA